MIIEIIVLLGFLGSLVGFIFFAKHYFKTSKKRSNDKKILLAIESSDDEYASNDKFYETILDKIDVEKVVKFVLIATIVFIFIFMFLRGINTTSNGNDGVEKPAIAATPTPILNDTNNTFASYVPGFLKDSTGQLSFWFFVITGGLMMWIIIKVIGRNSYYGL